MIRLLLQFLFCLASSTVSGFVPLLQQTRVSSLLRRPFRQLDDPATNGVDSRPSLLSDEFCWKNSFYYKTYQEHGDTQTSSAPIWQPTSAQVFGDNNDLCTDGQEEEEEPSDGPSIRDLGATNHDGEMKNSVDAVSETSTTSISQTRDIHHEETTVLPLPSPAAVSQAARAKLIPFMSLMDLLARLDKYRIPYDAWATRPQLEALLIQYEHDRYERAAAISRRDD